MPLQVRTARSTQSVSRDTDGISPSAIYVLLPRCGSAPAMFACWPCGPALPISASCRAADRASDVCVRPHYGSVPPVSVRHRVTAAPLRYLRIPLCAAIPDVCVLPGRGLRIRCVRVALLRPCASDVRVAALRLGCVTGLGPPRLRYLRVTALRPRASNICASRLSGTAPPISACCRSAAPRLRYLRVAAQRHRASDSGLLPAIRIKACDNVALTAIQPRAGAPTTQRPSSRMSPWSSRPARFQQLSIGPPRVERVTILAATLEKPEPPRIWPRLGRPRISLRTC
jgi:hypothetical protein